MNTVTASVIVDNHLDDDCLSFFVVTLMLSSFEFDDADANLVVEEEVVDGIEYCCMSGVVDDDDLGFRVDTPGNVVTTCATDNAFPIFTSRHNHKPIRSNGMILLCAVINIIIIMFQYKHTQPKVTVKALSASWSLTCVVPCDDDIGLKFDARKWISNRG
jgi:hypothetical protein